MLWPKKNSYKKFDYEKKNSCGSKIPLPPPPPHNVSNGPSLRELYKQPGVLSDTRQPEVDFLHSRAMGSNSRVNRIYKKNDT